MRAIPEHLRDASFIGAIEIDITIILDGHENFSRLYDKEDTVKCWMLSGCGSRSGNF